MRIKCSADIVGVPPKITKIEMFQITRTVPGGSGLEIMREFTPSVSVFSIMNFRFNFLLFTID